MADIVFSPAAEATWVSLLDGDQVVADALDDLFDQLELAPHEVRAHMYRVGDVTAQLTVRSVPGRPTEIRVVWNRVEGQVVIQHIEVQPLPYP